MSKAYLKNSWSFNGTMMDYSPLDGQTVYFWPAGRAFSYYTGVAYVYGVSRPILVTDFTVSKHINGTNGSAEPTKLYLVELQNVYGQNYFTGGAGPGPQFKKEYLLHSNIQFNKNILK